MKVHFIGIGGSGLSAIARLLMEKGYCVSGSDRVISPLAQSLQLAGATVFEGHRSENIQNPDVVVRSSAVKDDNPEVQAARNAGIPVLKRAEFLGQFMQEYTAIAVAGTHGKTTTTAMISWMLSAMGQDPSYIIGGVSKNLGNNAHSGRDGGFFVIEADEYDRMFIGLNPNLAVITNVQHDHPDCYPNPQIYQDAFFEFANRLKPGGTLVICQDDPGAAKLGDSVEKQAGNIRLLRYTGDESGTLSGSYYYARNTRLNTSGGFSFDFCSSDIPTALAEVHLKVPGRHNLLNGLAALAAAHCLDLPLAAASEALSQFEGTDRRFDLRGEPGGIALIDDYAHHPVEIMATLQSARLRYQARRIWAVWQPHTFSRIQALESAFMDAFKVADRVIMTDVYAAREQNSDFSAATLAANLHHPNVTFIPALSDVTSYLLEHLEPGDVVLILSAGDADSINTALLNEIPKINHTKSEMYQ